MTQTEVKPLPSLADSSRSRIIRRAHIMLVIAGILLAGFSLVALVRAEEVVQDKLAQDGVAHARPGQLQHFVWNEQVFQASQVGIGLVLTLLGLAIHRAPRFCSIAAITVLMFHLFISCLTLDPVRIYGRSLQVCYGIVALANVRRAAKLYRRANEPVAPKSDTHQARGLANAMPLDNCRHVLLDRPGEKLPPIQVYAAAPKQWGAFWSCLVALGLAGLGAWTGETICAWLAVPPALYSIALTITRPRPFHAVFGDAALEVLDPMFATIPWENIVAVSTSGKKSGDPLEPSSSNYAIHIVYSDGSLEIPASTNWPSDLILWSLLQRIPYNSAKDLPSGLVPYWQELVRLFGSQGISIYRSTRPPGLSWYRGRKLLVLALVSLATAAIWFFSEQGMIVALAIAATFFALLNLVLIFPFGRWYNSLKNSALVISPHGFALFQKPHIGYANWQEVTNVRWGYPSTELAYPGPCFSVTIEAQHFPIYDIYDRPLITIYRQMLHYWRGVDPIAASPAA